MLIRDTPLGWSKKYEPPLRATVISEFGGDADFLTQFRPVLESEREFQELFGLCFSEGQSFGAMGAKLLRAYLAMHFGPLRAADSGGSDADLATLQAFSKSAAESITTVNVTRDLETTKSSQVSGLVSLFHEAPDSKIRSLSHGTLINPFNENDPFKLKGSFVEKGTSIVFMSAKNENALVISSQHLIDAIYYPARLALFGSNLHLSGKKIRDVLARSILEALRHPDAYSQHFLGEAVTHLTIRAHSPRPVHVLAYEIRAFSMAMRSKPNDASLWVSPRSAFFSRRHLSRIGGDIRTDREVSGHWEGTNVVFGTNPSPGFQQNEEHWNWLAAGVEGDSIGQRFERKPTGLGLWLSVTNGEKRFWMEENKTLTAIITLVRTLVGRDFHVVFDGWTGTSTSSPSSLDSKMTSLHEEALEEIVAESSLDQENFKSVIGKTATDKIQAAKTTSIFVSSGTSAMWPIKFGRIPGIMHGTPELLQVQFRQFGRPGNVVFPQASEIQSIPSSQSPPSHTRPPQRSMAFNLKVTASVLKPCFGSSSVN